MAASSPRARLKQLDVLRAGAVLLAWVGGYSCSIYVWHLVVGTLGLSVFRRAYARGAALLGALLPQQPHTCSNSRSRSRPAWAWACSWRSSWRCLCSG
jgi:peptidoglycan/LPS O-acetylase OafA/YrhL